MPRVYVVDSQGVEWFSDLKKVEEPVNGGPAPLTLTHRIMTDAEIGRTNRYNMPMVWVFNDVHVVLTKEWQMYLVAINHGMPRPNNISHIIGDGVAYCNRTGTGGKAHRRDYITMQNLDQRDPETDKTRSSGDAKLHLSNGAVAMLDGTKPPPLKAGFAHPQNTAEAYNSIDRYVYTPQYYPEYFCANYTTGNDGNCHPWPNGALYPWWKNGTEPVSFFFHVAKSTVTYPPTQWTDNTPYMKEI